MKMYYVYLLRSERRPLRTYVGFSADLKKRLADHNAGRNTSTKIGRPWKVVFYAAFEGEDEAKEFEEYLKTASGKAFARKRLLPKGE